MLAVVVTMNREERLWRNVHRILSEGADVLVINNGRTLTKVPPVGCTVVDLGDNTGPAGGFACGLKRALSAGEAGALWLFNDDDAPHEGALSRMLEALRSADDVGAVAAWTAAQPYGQAGANYRSSDAPQKRPGSKYEVEWASFTGLLVAAKAARDVPGVDESYFFYGEETDFCLQLKAAGWRVEVLGEVLIDGGAVGSVGRTPEWRAYYQARNGLLIARRWGTARHWRRHIVRMAKVTVVAFAGEAPVPLLRARARGLVDGARGVTGRTVVPPEDVGS